MTYTALIQGGEGPDIWDHETHFNAINITDAALLAQARANDLGGHVVLIDLHVGTIPEEEVTSPSVIIMSLCEIPHILLKPNQLYRFEVSRECKACEIAAELAKCSVSPCLISSLTPPTNNMTSQSNKSYTPSTLDSPFTCYPLARQQNTICPPAHQ